MSAVPGRFAPVTQYDGIAAQYQRSKHSPIRRHVEAWSFFRMLGPVDGLAVLDLACGEGFYTRQLARRGARPRARRACAPRRRTRSRRP